MIVKFKRFSRSNSRKTSINGWGRSSSNKSDKGSSLDGLDSGGRDPGEIKWELRPGGMLVQMREDSSNTGRNKGAEETIIIKVVSTVSDWHDISIESTSTFGGLKKLLSMVTGLEPREQRLLYRGKEREDDEHLHMVGVRDGDKVLLLEDPAIKEKKLRSLIINESISSPHAHPYRSAIIV